MSEFLRFYHKGCELTKQEQFGEAKEAFTQSLQGINHLNEFEFVIKLWLNRGFCLWKCRDYDFAIEDFTSVLERLDILISAQSLQLSVPWLSCIDNFAASWKNYRTKALYRRAICLDYTGQYRAAFADLSELMEYDEAITLKDRSCSELFSRLRQHIDADRRAASSEGRPAWLSSQHQALRLNFARSFPKHVQLNEAFTIKVALGNELGLFDRQSACISAGGDPQQSLGTVFCELIQLNSQSKLPDNLALIQFCGSDPDPKKLCKVIGGDGKAIMHLCFINNAIVDESLSDDTYPMVFMLRFSVQLESDLDVLPLLTLPITLTARARLSRKTVQALSNSLDSFGNLFSVMESVQVNCIRPMIFQREDHNTEILCGESVGLLGIGGKIWDSSFILSRYLQATAVQFITNKRVLEIGCGTGVTGLSLAPLRPSSMILTDLAEVIALTSINIQLNQRIGSMSEWITSEQYQAIPYSWGEELNVECDTIIASDVIYYPEGYEPLLQTIQLLLVVDHEKHPNRVWILAHRHRHPEDGRFFSALEQMQEISVEEIRWKETLQQEERIVCGDVRILVLRKSKNV